MGSSEGPLSVRRTRRARSVLVCWTVFVMAASVSAQDGVVIPYHGLLTDSGGGPVNSDAPLTVVFRIYGASEGGAAEWSETHEEVSIVGGRFSVLLGEREPFPDDLGMFFGRTVYVGVTVDNGDREVADVEMRPRQAIVPVVASRWAADAGRAERAGEADRALAADRAATADRALAADRAATADRVPSEVPLGGVVMFYGDPGELPTNWLICDGRTVEDPESPLDGRAVPDLRGLFVRGAGGMGDGNYEPDHNHSYAVGGGPGVTGTRRTGRAGGHYNRPRHMELHYIIRIR